MAAISTTDLYNAYLAYFGRPPDLAGLAYFSTKTEAEVLATFAASDESRELLAGSSLEDSINNVYLNLFNRDAEFAGLTYWIGQITSGAFTLAEAAMEILRGAQGTDLETVQAKNGAMVAFVAAIDTTREAIGYNGMEAAADGRAFIATVGYHWDGDVIDGVLHVPSAAEVDAAVLVATTNNVDPIADQTLFLGVGNDVLAGDIGNDLFVADINQNSLGAQVNTLGTGDRLDGAAGNDALEAQVTEGANYGGLGMPVQPRTTSIETVKFEAVNSHIGMDQTGTNVDLDLAGILGGLIGGMGGSGQDGPITTIPDSITLLNLTPVLETSTTEVYVNAKDMLGVESLWSWHSDANLTIQNLTTQKNEGNHTMRPVDAMTIGMGYTGNDDSKWEESDMHVYFDQDYLNPSLISSDVSVTWELMNEDGYDYTNGTQPLGGVYLSVLEFTLNGKTYDFTPYLDAGNLQNTVASAGTTIETYPEMVAALQAALVLMKAANPSDAALQQATISLGGDFTADRNPDTGILRVGQKIILDVPGLQSNGTQNTLTALDIGAELDRCFGEGAIPNNNRWENADDTPPTLDQELRINVALEKAGNAGEGGELVIGSMSKEAGNHWSDATAHKGIEIFDVTVYGDEARSSNVSGLYSTNNTLKAVNVVSDVAAGKGEKDYADLTIGNDNTKVGASSNGNGYGLKDVRTFDSTKFLGDLTLNAVLTSETIAKYQDLVDTSSDDTVDDVLFSYKLGVGDDNITLTMDGDVGGFVVAGTDPSARHDFDFLVDGGAGNDNITVIMPEQGVGQGNPFFMHPMVPAEGDTQNWYNDQQINHNITVNGGAGNDTIRTPGAGDMYINGGSGNDTIYSDNTGFNHNNILPLANPTTGEVVYNDGRAVWVLNAVPGQAEIYNIESQTAASVKAVNAWVTVSYRDISVSVNIGNSQGSLTNVAITDLKVNQAIKDAINNDPVLSKLAIAEDGAGHSLVVRSLIDGDFNGRRSFDYSELEISFFNKPLTASQAVAVPAVTLYTNALGVTAGLEDGYTVDSQFATIGGSSLDGADSYTSTDNTITGGDGNDVIVLSTTEFGHTRGDFLQGSNETVVYAPAFGNDTIVNFDANQPRVITEDIYDTSENVQETALVTFGNTTLPNAGMTMTFDGVSVLLHNGLAGLVPAADIAYDFVQQYNANGARTWYATLQADGVSVELVKNVFGNQTDLTAGDFVVSGGATIPTTVTTIEQGEVAYVAPTAENFYVNFGAGTPGSVAVTGGVYAFDGTNVAYAAGDGAITLADKVAASTFANWDVTETGPGVVHFVSKTLGNIPDASAPAAPAGITAGITYYQGTDGQGTNVFVETVTYTTNNEGMDYLDFTALGGDMTTQTDLTTFVSTNKSINVVAQVALVNDTAAHLKTFLDASVVDGVGAGTESTHVVVVYNTNNVGSVYQVTDGVADNDVVVTLAGTIDLADTPWGTLATTNFV